MSKYRETQNKIIFDILSQIKSLFPVCDKDFYYMTMQTKLYNLALRWGLVKRLRKFGVLD